MCMELNGCYGDTPFLPSESSGQTKSHNSHSRRHVITTAMQGGAVAVMRRENNSEQTEQGAVLVEETVKMDSAARMGLA